MPYLNYFANLLFMAIIESQRFLFYDVAGSDSHLVYFTLSHLIISETDK